MPDENRPVVLAIDNECRNDDYFLYSLKDSDYRVLVAPDGRTGFAIFVRHNPDVVLLDLRLPDEDGLHTLSRIAERAPETPVIVVADAGMIEQVVDALRLGAWDYFRKPVKELTALRGAIEKALARARLQREKHAYRQQLETEVASRTAALAQSNAELQRLNARLRQIVQAGQVISGCTDSAQCASHFLDSMGRQLQATGGSLYRVESAGLYLLHALDPGHAPAFIPFPLAEGSILRQVVRTGQPLLLDNLASTRSLSGSGWTGYHHPSLLVFPILEEPGQVAAVVSLHNKTQPPFTAQDLDIGALLVSYGGEALRAVRAIEALRASEQKYRLIFENLQDAYYEVTPAGTIIEISPSVESISQYRRNELLGANIWQLYADHNEREGLLKQLRRSGRVSDYEIHLRNKDGAIVPCAITAQLCLENAASPRICGTIRNIARRKQAEEALRLAATAFETHEGIIVTDKHARILRVNQAFCQITGYHAADVLGRPPRLLRSEQQNAGFYRHIWRTLRKQGRWQGEIWNRRRNGEVFPQWLSVTAVCDTQGAVTHYVGTFLDLSELKQQQQIIARTALEEQALGALLRLALQPLTLQAFLQAALDALFQAIPWLHALPWGGVCIATTEQAHLRCLARHGTAAPPDCCAGLPAEHWPPADPAAPGLYRADETGYHYVLIRSDSIPLGALVLDLPPGRQLAEHQINFLQRAADVLSMGVARRFAEARVEHLAYYDTLTGLPNRRLLSERLQQVQAQCRNTYGAVLLLDLDRFKIINDALGHPLGDRLIKQVAERLVERAPTDACVARFGGDAFAVLLADLGERRQAARGKARNLAETLRRTLAKPYDSDGHDYHLSASTGLLLFDARDIPADIFKHADTALHRAKACGRNSIQSYLPSMQAAADARLTLEKQLRYALPRDELQLFFQPQVNNARRIVGAEALLRWRHPQRGLVGPSEFIPLAEETGLIVAIGHWVLEAACRQFSAWSAQHPDRRLNYMAVNISPRQFRQPDFTVHIERVLAQTGVTPPDLVLELTEGVVIDDIAEATAKMQTLQKLGTRLSIDDFGMGYSSLSYLKRLPLDILKIDRSFVRDVAEDADNGAIVDTIIAIATRLGLQVVAEGVETAVELDVLQHKGCHFYQGYYFSRPLPAEAFAALMAERNLPPSN